MKEYLEIIRKLETGERRAAYKDENGNWHVDEAVKMAILDAFKDGENIQFNEFVDKHNILPRKFRVDEGVRIVPGGTSIRKGSYVSKGVIIMPPSYINIGAYVDEGTMVDSHALVGSCAQIGKRVHLSAGVQIGGVLEPIGLNPVIIEDDAFIGAGAVIVEGVQVSRGAVIAPGVCLSKSIPIYDVVEEKVLKPGTPIPPNAVVVNGSRPVNEKYKWANENSLTINCPVIIKYRDEKSESSLELENLLR